MITKVSSAGHFGGAYMERGSAKIDDQGNRYYAEKSDRVEAQFGRNIASDPTDRHAVEKEMRAQAATNARAEKHFHKATLSLHPDEHKTPEEWQQIADDYAEKMGLEDRQMWGNIHKDTDHQHVHLTFTRAGEGGDLWSDSHDYQRAHDAAREIEHQHDLYRVQSGTGKYAEGKAPTDDPAQQENGPPTRGAGLPSDAVQQFKRTGEIPFAARVNARRDEIKNDLRESDSLEDANARLAKYDMEIRATDRGGVIADANAPPETNRAKALSAVDRQSSFPKLKSRWQEHERRREQDPGRSQTTARGSEKEEREGISR